MCNFDDELNLMVSLFSSGTFLKSGKRFYFQSGFRIKTARGARFGLEISGFIVSSSVSSLVLRA